MKSVLYFFLILVSMPGHAQKTDVWKIPADTIDPADYYGETVANGMIGIVSSASPLKCQVTVLNGTYDRYGRGGVSNLLKCFPLVDMDLRVDGQPVVAGNIKDLRQVLDMKKASLTTTFTYQDKARVSYTYYALRDLPYTVLTDVSIVAKKDIDIIAASVMEAPPELRDVHTSFQQIGKISLLTSDAKSPTGKLTLAASTTFLFDDAGISSPRVAWDSTRHLAQFHRKIPAGMAFHFSIAGSMISTQQTEDPVNEAERYTIYAALQGTGNLVRRHCQAWEDLWKSDITIVGDDVSQRAVHAALYHLYSFVRPGTANSISPMGLSGIGYNGHIFWDAELWMFPVLLVLHPGMAKSMIEYRCQRLPQAEQNAFAHGFKGAMYPWESDATGNEATPVWALTGPFEHHITADVAIAAWNYYRVTQDTAWLRQKGFPVIKACADFWVSRVEKDNQRNDNINNVVAADEWAENVDNNAFTNGAAKTNLQYAVLAAKILHLPVDGAWITVGEHIPILKMAGGVTSEHATYRGEKIKQADVNLLAYPLKVITGTAQIKRDLAYYSTRIGEGSPAMTHAIFAVLYARLHEPAKAWNAFEEAYIPNQKAPFGVLAETAGGTNPYFATGAGGFLQSVLFGFGGLEITSGGLVQVPTSLPPRWKSVTITGAGRSRQTFSVTQNGTH